GRASRPFSDAAPLGGYKVTTPRSSRPPRVLTGGCRARLHLNFPELPGVGVGAGPPRKSPGFFPPAAVPAPAGVPAGRWDGPARTGPKVAERANSPRRPSRAPSALPRPRPAPRARPRVAPGSNFEFTGPALEPLGRAACSPLVGHGQVGAQSALAFATPPERKQSAAGGRLGGGCGGVRGPCSAFPVTLSAVFP
ncbi:Unconventional Myosin-Ixb, partial [Manis pentadactyla]